MARPTKEQKEQMQKIEAEQKRDSIEYLEFEQQCTNIAKEFKHDCFMAYEMANACMMRAHIFDARVSAYHHKNPKIYYDDDGDNSISPETIYLSNLKHSKASCFYPVLCSKLTKPQLPKIATSVI